MDIKNEGKITIEQAIKIFKIQKIKIDMVLYLNLRKPLKNYNQEKKRQILFRNKVIYIYIELINCFVKYYNEYTINDLCL